MSETEKKSSKRRKERGLNVRVVQEQKDKKPDGVRVNTRVKKPSTRKKGAKRNTKKDTKKDAKKNVEIIIEKSTKKTEKTEKIETPVLNNQEFSDFEWKKEEKLEKIEKAIKEEKAEKKEEQKTEKASEDFETLKLHINTKKPTSKVIVRDVAKEKPIEAVQISREIPVAITPKTTSKVTPKKKLSAKEIKEQEIKKAVSTAAKLPTMSKKRGRRSRLAKNFGATRAILAIACLSTAVFALVYFLNLNSTDISLKVVAMQSGIEAVYPSYTPRGYTLADVTSSSGKITMKFKSENGSYTITEEQTDWNSDGLLSNFIRPTYGDDYTKVEEQGLSIYMGDKWSAWINGGMLYKLTVDSGSLTKKQIKAIVVSL